MKKIKFLPLTAFALLAMTSCSDDDNNALQTENPQGQVTAKANFEENGDYDVTSSVRSIELNGTTAISNDATVIVNQGSRIIITQEGTYHVTGSLTNGQLVVDADQDDKVRIILDDVSITSAANAAIDIQNADKVIINLKAGTTSTIAANGNNSQNSAIFSRTRLSIFGTGILNVNGTSNAAIASEGGVILKEGTINLNSSLDAVTTDHNIIVFSGQVNVNANGDGFNADEDITVNNGTINITNSEDGFEAGAVNILNGNLKIVANKDGISVDGENTSAATELVIKDGYVYVNAAGNGLNANGSISIDNGTVIVEGPATDNGLAVNYSSSFTINGGHLIAVNANGTIDAPGENSLQNSVVVKFGQLQQANTLVHLQSTLGANVTTFRPSKSFKTVLISSAQINDNGTFQVFTGGTVTGDVLNGLYDLVNYIGGSLAATFTVTGTVTTIPAS